MYCPYPTFLSRPQVPYLFPFKIAMGHYASVWPNASTDYAQIAFFLGNCCNFLSDVSSSFQVCLHMFTLDFLNQVANGLEKDSMSVSSLYLFVCARICLHLMYFSWVQLSSRRKTYPFNSRSHTGIQAGAIHIWRLSLCTFDSTFRGTRLYSFPLHTYRMFVFLKNSYITLIKPTLDRHCAKKNLRQSKMPTDQISTPQTAPGCLSFACTLVGWLLLVASWLIQCPSTLLVPLLYITNSLLLNSRSRVYKLKSACLNDESGVEVSPLCSYAGENLEAICRGRTFHAPCEISF